MNLPKLLLHHTVEVRQLEEGLKGSWHPGVVVGVSDLSRKVKYDGLLCESGMSKLIESIPVTGEIDGLYQRTHVKFDHRGRIRPIPPLQQPSCAEAKLSFGVCVDVFYKEAWWEGVIFDCNEDAKKRRVYFPDECYEGVFNLADLRVTFDWDEFSGQWRERGVWMLVTLAKEHKKGGKLFHFIKRVWILLKANYGFQKMISEWTCGAHCMWKEYFRQVIYDMNAKNSDSVPRRRDLMLSQQKKVGMTERYPSRRKGRRVRSPKRIKKMHQRKTQDTSVDSMPTLQKAMETSKLKEDENHQSKRAQHVTTSCQDPGPQDTLDDLNELKVKRSPYLDSVCLVCQYGGELLHCDLCLSSYHSTCIYFEEVPAGESFCPSCKCGICGLEHSVNDDQLLSQACYQCGRRYHVACLHKAGTIVSEDSLLDNFCSRSCYEICARLHELLQISNPTEMEGLTWTITRSRRNDCNVHNQRVHPLIQVSQVLKVFHECFEPITEPHTGRDLVADIVYNNGSKLRRLDFHGFYVISLVEGEEVVCVATIRIHGQKVAEMPLIATRFKYRKKGMCRLLVDELEKMLAEMGVERLVLPGISQLTDTWVSSFGFEEMPALLRKELLGYPFVLFQGTSMFQKILRSARADPLQEALNLERNELAFVQENQKFNLNHKRTKKSKAPSKQKAKKLTDGADRNQSIYKCVYKRWRIQASRDSLHS